MNNAYFDANTCNIDDVISTIDELGYVILENAINKNSIKQLHKELEPHFTKRAVSNAHFFGFNTKRIEALFSKSKAVQNMATNSHVLDIVDHILGGHCDSFQINLTQGIRINPNEKAQILHPDSAMFPIPNKPFEFMVNALWAYSDFIKDNGATIIVPGSHKWVEGREPQPHEITYAEMKQGSVLIYAASLLHAGGANVTNEARTGIALSYCLGWLRQSENQYLSYSIEEARQFSPALQELIGYNVHKPNLGWVHGHNPLDLLLGVDNSEVGAEDFLTDEQNHLLEAYRSGNAIALTSHDL